METPWSDDSAGLAEALAHADGALEWVSESPPAPGSTISAAGAGWPGAAAYSPLIKAEVKGACVDNSPTPPLLPNLRLPVRQRVFVSS